MGKSKGDIRKIIREVEKVSLMVLNINRSSINEKVNNTRNRLLLPGLRTVRINDGVGVETTYSELFMKTFFMTTCRKSLFLLREESLKVLGFFCLEPQ